MRGTLLGPYRLDAQIGAGGMGTVWRATVEGAVPGVQVGERVAVKVVHPHLAVDLDVFERFVREAALGRSIRHENVVRTLDAGIEVTDDGEFVYLAMEHVVGRTLAQFRDETGPAPEGFCRRIAREVARGLQGIHVHGVVHGDLKPENVLITGDEVVKVMDLGLARLRAGALNAKEQGRFSGSLLYAAPEQFGREQTGLDGRIDLFALGVTLFELAAGRHPWASPDGGFLPRQIETDAPRLRSARPDVSEFLETVVAALLARDPERRIRSAAELSSILAAAEDGPWARARRAAAARTADAAHAGDRAARAARLHGREGELAALWSRLREAQAHRGGTVVVEGGPGSGRTRLVEELLDAATGAGIVVEVARCAFGPGRSGADVVAPLAAPASPGAVSVRVAEDVDRAGPAAWEALAVLADDARGRDALNVLTCCGPLPLAGWDALGRPTRLAPGPLADDAMTDLIADVLLAGRPSRSFSLWLDERSGGSPGVALAWLEQLTARHALRASDDGTWELDPLTAGAGDVPARVLAYGERALRAVNASDRELLEAAACAGRDFDADLVAAAIGMPARDFEARCGVVERTGVLRRVGGARWEFSETAAHATALAGVADALRDEYRKALAEVLRAEDPRDDREALDLVELLLVTDEGPLPAADVAHALARLAADDRPDAVVSLCDAAIPRLSEASARAAARLWKARALLALGRPGAARVVLDEAIGETS